MSALKKSISMPAPLWARLELRVNELGYSTVSAYFQQLVWEDLMRQGAHLRGVDVLRESPSPAPITPVVPPPVNYKIPAADEATLQQMKRRRTSIPGKLKLK